MSLQGDWTNMCGHLACFFSQSSVSPEFWMTGGWVGGGGVRNISLSPSVRDAVLKPYFASHLADIWGVLNNMNYVLRNKLLTLLEFLQEHFNPDPQDHPRSLFLAHFPQCKQTWVLIVIKHTVCRSVWGWGGLVGRPPWQWHCCIPFIFFIYTSGFGALCTVLSMLVLSQSCFILKGVDFKA